MMHSTRARQLFCVLVAAMLAGGCGSSDVNAKPTASNIASAEPTAAPTTPSPAVTTPARVTAADGENYRACADGTCEVAVSKPRTIRLGGRAGAGSRVKVRKVLANGLDLDLALAGGGGFSGKLLFKDACGTISRAGLTGGGSGEFCNADGSPLPAPEPQAGTVALQVPGKTSGGAIVVRIVSG